MEQRIMILEKIQEIFRTELNNNTLIITDNSSTNNVENWDSMNNLIIISAIETEFNISFPIDIIFNARNVGDLCDYILSQQKI